MNKFSFHIHCVAPTRNFDSLFINH